ncbi:MAG TPA: S41 family peptidase [Ktedonobacteraceae bacterium]
MSRYDDPRWYEEQQFNQPVPNKPAYDDLNPAHHADNNAFQWPDSSRQGHIIQEEPRSRQIARQILVGSALVIVAFLGGWFSHQYFGDTLTQNSQSQKYSQLFEQAWNVIDQNYVDRKAVNYQNMSYTAINAMVSSLHDKGHTYFLTPAQSKSFDQQESGKFVGIGITLSQDPTSKKFIINSTMVNSPAAKAGLRRNDIILSVNGTTTQGKSLDDVSKLISGNVGTAVTMIIQHQGAPQPQTFHIVRAEITEQNVIMHYIAQDHIAHIQIVQFADGVSDQLKTSITQAKSMGATKIILDLRNNGGGIVQEAINTVSDFVKSGDVYLEKDSSGHITPVSVTGTTLDTRIPLVVLVNENSASAAEIVPGSLKDNGRAMLIGTQTFGTGTVMNRFDLSDGSVLWVGVDEWLTPKGKFIRDQGITPNITVKLPANASILTPNDENVQNMTLQQIDTSGDSQLVRAIQYLEQGH